jgi:hypothetical protein
VAALELSQLVEMLPDRKSPEILTIAVKEQFIFIFSLFLARVVLFLPILIAAWVSYRSLTLRAIFMVLIFMSVFGWARSNPLFSEQYALVYDFAAVGFLALLYVLLAGNRLNGFWVSAVALICGQLFFENLGIVVGVSVALYLWAMSEEEPSRRRRASLIRLVQLAGVSLATLAALIALFKFGLDNPAGEQSFSLTKYFKESWEVYGRVNFIEIYDIVENILELLAYPILGGILLALLASYVFKNPDKDIASYRREFWAALAVWAGFWATLVPGMFLSGLYYEMGRQLIPLACFTTVFVTKSVEYYLVRKMRVVASAG